VPRFSCSLQAIFEALAEVIKTDAEAASKLLGPDRRFKVTRQTRKIIVVRAEHDDEGADSIVLELSSTGITAKKGRSGDVLFDAKPVLNEEGECVLEVNDRSLRLWQVSRKALENLFFHD
jgi:hypothetical protein